MDKTVARGAWEAMYCNIWLNGKAVHLYAAEGHPELVIANVETTGGKHLGGRTMKREELENVSGNNAVGRVANLISYLTDGRYFGDDDDA